MMNLSDYFTGIAYKKLSAVEVDAKRSHQHEFNGIGLLKDMFGEKKKEFTARFAYFMEGQEEPITADVKVTWYDARENHSTRTEYRLYYQDSRVNEYIQEGDLTVIATRPDKAIYFFIAQKDSTYEKQLALLFELPDHIGTTIESRDLTRQSWDIDFVRLFILEEIGIETVQSDAGYLDLLLNKFPEGFPGTSEFSSFARGTLPPEDLKNDPDGALIRWMEREERLFRTFEQYLLAEKIKNGFTDVDKFIDLSLSVQNRRKARVGYALENHLRNIFQELKISFSHGRETENNAKPDFIFPGTEQYHDDAFPEDGLHMLGAKSTCKDRWRQVLAEAARIKRKHLLTLEPGISTNQTNEMKANALQLVIPAPLYKTYTDSQQKELINLKNFIAVVKK